MASQPLAGVVRYLHRVSGSAGFEPTDADLIALFAGQRDPVAFEALVRRHGSLVLGVCQRVLGAGPDVDDAVQATFLVLARKAGGIRLRDSLASWLHAVAYNMSMQLRKKRAVRRRRETALDSADPSMPVSADPVHQVSLRELGAILDQELQRLPVGCRAAIVACHLEGQSTSEAAHLLGVPASTLKTRLQRGRELLRQRLERRGVGLSAMALTVVLVEQSRAGMTYALVRTTVEAAVRFAASGTVPVSGQAATLAWNALKTTAVAKIKLPLLAMVTFGLLGLGAAVVPSSPRPSVKAFTDPGQKEGFNEVAKGQQGDPLPVGALARLGSTRWRHDGSVYFADFLADGKTVITAATDRTVRVWDFPSGKEIRRVVPAPLNIKSDRKIWGLRDAWPVALNVDGKTIALGSCGVGIGLYDVQTMKELPGLDESDAVLPNKTHFTTRVLAFSPSGEHLASLDSETGTIRIWDWRKANLVRSFGGPGADGFFVNGWECSNTLIWAPDGKSIVTVQPRNSGNKFNEDLPISVVKFWDFATGKENRSITVNEGYFDCFLAYSPDGKTFVLSTAKGNRVVDVASGREIHKFSSDSVNPPSLLFSKDGTKLYERVYGKGILLEHDVVTGKIIRKFGSGQELESGGGFAIFGGFGGIMESMSLSPDGSKLVLTGSGKHMPQFIDLKTGKETAVVSGHRAPVLAVAFSPDGKDLLTEDRDGSFKTWDIAAAKELDGGPIAEAATITEVSQDGKIIANWVRGPHGAITLFDTITGKILGKTQKELNETSASLRFAPHGKTLAFRQRLEQKIELYEVPSAKLLQSIDIATGFIKTNQAGAFMWTSNPAPQTMIFSADCKLLASYSDPKTFGIWDTTTGQKVVSLDLSQSRSIEGGTFSPDRRSLALDLSNGAVQLYEVATGRTRRTYGKKGKSIESPVRIENIDRPFSDKFFGPRVAFAPDGKALAYGGQDGGLRFWDISSGEEFTSLKGHSASVNAVAFAANGKKVASGSSDTTILIWDATKISGPAVVAKPLQAKELDACWKALADTDGDKAFAAICDLGGDPKEAVAMLKAQVKPVPTVNAQRIRDLIGQVDDGQYKVREKAAGDLFKIGEQIVPFIEGVLAKGPSRESRSRLEGLRSKIFAIKLEGDRLRDHRAIEVLERIGNAEARQVLQTLAEGAPGALVTSQAQGALERLKR